MALIQCPECSQEISNQAVVCPQCGYPLQARQPAPQPSSNEADPRIREALLAGDKIAAIKLYRGSNPNLSLSEAKQHVD